MRVDLAGFQTLSGPNRSQSCPMSHCPRKNYGQKRDREGACSELGERLCVGH
jgi:hypothetical protein